MNLCAIVIENNTGMNQKHIIAIVAELALDSVDNFLNNVIISFLPSLAAEL